MWLFVTWNFQVETGERFPNSGRQYKIGYLNWEDTSKYNGPEKKSRNHSILAIFLLSCLICHLCEESVKYIVLILKSA